jgi:hypothetical protein
LALYFLLEQEETSKAVTTARVKMIFVFISINY